MIDIFCVLNQLLIKPDVNNAISEKNIQLYEQNRSSYELRVRKHCEQYAIKSIDRLLDKYQLRERL